MLRALEEADKSKQKTKVTLITDMNDVLYRNKVGTPPFLLSLRIFGKNIHNFLLDLGAIGNVIPFSICKNLVLIPVQSDKKVIQLDKIEVNVVGELKNVYVQVTSYPWI